MDKKPGLLPFVLLLGIYLILAAVLPAADDEVYYWSWSKDLQWSYFDHPPMTAVLIRLSTAIFGDSIFGFRVPACIASAFVVYVISRLTPLKPLVWGVILSPLFTIGAVLITPDSPLMMCWAAYLWWSVALHRHLTPGPDQGVSTAVPLRLWLIGGVILGCGVLSKYTMGLAVPVGFLCLLLSRRPPKEWLSGYLLHGVVAFVVASPILIYNIQQNFEPLLFQWRHSAQQTPNALRSIVEFIGVQILLFGTIPYFLFPWVISHFRRLCDDPRLRVCTCFYAVPLAFFLYKSTQARLEGNWALVSFVSVWPVAAEWFQTVRTSRFWRQSTILAFTPPALAVLVICVHLLWPISWIPPKLDRVYRQFALKEATQQVAEKIRALGESIPVYTDSYQMTAWLRFQSLPAQQIDGVSPRASHYTRPSRKLTDVDRAYVVTNRELKPEFTGGFSPPDLIATIPISVRGEAENQLNIRLYTRQKKASNETEAGVDRGE